MSRHRELSDSASGVVAAGVALVCAVMCQASDSSARWVWGYAGDVRVVKPEEKAVSLSDGLVEHGALPSNSSWYTSLEDARCAGSERGRWVATRPGEQQEEPLPTTGVATPSGSKDTSKKPLPVRLEPVELVRDTMSGWDKAQILIGGIIVPVFVALLVAWFGARVNAKLEERRRLDTLAQYIPLLTSNDERTVELAKRVLGVSPEDGTVANMPGFRGVLLEPSSIEKTVRDVFNREGPRIAPFRLYRDRVCYGWVGSSLVPLSLAEDDAWKTGIAHERWVIFAGTRRQAGVFFLRGRGEAFRDDEVVCLPGSLLAVRHTLEPTASIGADTSDSAAYGLVGYSEEEDGLTLMLERVVASTFGECAITVNGQFQERLLGFVAARPGNRGIIGVVSGSSEAESVEVTRWSAVLRTLSGQPLGRSSERTGEPA